MPAVRLSPDRAARRRLASLAFAAAVALVAGVLAGAGGGGDPAPPGATAAAPSGPEDGEQAVDPAVAEARGLRGLKLAGQTVIMRFAGSPEPAYVRRALRGKRAAGVILFHDNAVSPEATRGIARRVQRAAGGDALIAADQEGGAIRILRWAPPEPGQSALSTPAEAAEASRQAAAALRAHGVNVNLGPVADLGAPGPVMDSRAFADDPVLAARMTAAAVRAYRGTGVAPTVKHFPGLGAASVNTDDAPATIDRDAAMLGTTDLPPFKAAIAADVPLVMLSHAVYPALDPDAIASQSHAIATELLRERLGFDGVSMTDSIEAQAVTSRMGPEEAAVASMRAGVDIILTTGPGSHLRAVRALAAEAREDPAFRERLREAAARVIALRNALGQ